MQEFLNRVIHGDCSEIMQYMPSDSVDLTVTSPPYDDLRKYNGFVFPFEEIAKGLYRVTKQGGVVVWVVGDATVKGSETGTSFKQALYFKEIGFNLHDTMIYKKNNGQSGSNKCYKQVFEYMFVFSKGKIKTVNLIRDLPNKRAGEKRIITKRKQDGTLKKENFIVNEFSKRTNIWEIDCGYMITTKDKFAYEHPAMFPEKLAEDHILSWSNPGDIVFDPMCGAGTTLKMAYANNRDFIGIDYSVEYVELSQERLKKVMS